MLHSDSTVQSTAACYPPPHAPHTEGSRFARDAPYVHKSVSSEMHLRDGVHSWAASVSQHTVILFVSSAVKDNILLK